MFVLFNAMPVYYKIFTNKLRFYLLENTSYYSYYYFSKSYYNIKYCDLNEKWDICKLNWSNTFEKILNYFYNSIESIVSGLKFNLNRFVKLFSFFKNTQMQN